LNWVCTKNGLLIELDGEVSYADASNPCKHGQRTLNGDDDDDAADEYTINQSINRIPLTC